MPATSTEEDYLYPILNQYLSEETICRKALVSFYCGRHSDKSRIFITSDNASFVQALSLTLAESVLY